jgi:quercetin dioxygenase-like cupin family protein
MRKFLVGAASMAVLGALFVAATALATPQSGFMAAQQWKGVFDEIDVKTHQVKIKAKGTSDVYVTRNAIAPRTETDPGGQSGWHTHPGPSLIIVTAGEIMAYDGDDPTCTPTRYAAGEGFVDQGDGHVHLLRNETNAPAETVAIQILPKDAARRIDAVDPGNCHF